MKQVKQGVVSKKLLTWYDQHRRNLPWRFATPNPYKTWISEIMLQQTQVETVIPYYQKFLKRFPNVETLAKASLEEVLTNWSGLGYYSRARNLHLAAKQVVDKGTFPSAKADWLELPGIGPYTAGAIASIAFGERSPVVDGNVIRVLTRLFALAGDPKKNPLKQKLWDLALKLLPQRRVGDFNQSLMELGATICPVKNPVCPGCPLKNDCQAFQKNRVEAFPTPPAKTPTQKINLAALVIQKEGTFLLARRSAENHFKSMWEFPQTDQRDAALLKQLGIEAKIKGQLPEVGHSIMNRRLRVTPFLYHHIKGKPRTTKQYVAFQWIKGEALKNFPTSSLNFKILKNI